MTIASEVQRIKTNIANAYTACNNKGATMPASQESANLATCIGSIPSGTTPTGTLSITANGVYDVTNYASADVSVSGGGETTFTIQEVTPSNIAVYDIWTDEFNTGAVAGTNYSEKITNVSAIDKILLYKYNNVPVTAILHFTSGSYTYLGTCVDLDYSTSSKLVLYYTEYLSSNYYNILILTVTI